MADEHIQTEVKKRKVTFHPVTKDELDSLVEKNLFGDISSLLASLSLSALLTGILTKQISQNPSIEAIQFLNGVIVISIALLILSLVLVVYFKVTHRRKIKSIIGETPIQFSVKEVDEELNPNYYIGNQRIIMNILRQQQHKFHRHFQSQNEFGKLKTSEHTNNPKGNKKEYFTFIINNGNEHLFTHFRNFLKDNKIDYIDYK